MQIIVTKIPADRVPVFTEDECKTVLPAAIDLAHRMACEAAQLHSLQPHMGNERRASWRDWMSPETRALVQAIEGDWLGHSVEFVHEDESDARPVVD